MQTRNFSRAEAWVPAFAGMVKWAQPEVSHFSFLQDPDQSTADALHFLKHAN